MKILQVAEELGDAGGIAVYARLLERTLEEYGHECLTAACLRKTATAVPHNLIETSQMFSMAPNQNASWDLARFSSSLPWKPDVVISHQPPLPRVASDLSELAPLLIFQHSFLCENGHLFRDRDEVCGRSVGLACFPRWYVRQCGSDKDPRMAVRMIRKADRNRVALSFAATIVANSQYLAQRLQAEGLAGDRIKVVHPGCAPLILNDSVPNHRRSTGPLVSFAGRLVHAKGPQVLLDAIAETQAELQMAGAGWYEPPKKASQSRDVSFRGLLNSAELGVLHSSAWVSALPSIWPEPFAMTGVEALSYGTPVVAFDVGGIREWLSPDVGTLVSPVPRNRAKRFGQALAGHLNSPPSPELTEACKERAQQIGGLASFGKRLEELLTLVVPSTSKAVT